MRHSTLLLLLLCIFSVQVAFCEDTIVSVGDTDHYKQHYLPDVSPYYMPINKSARHAVMGRELCREFTANAFAGDGKTIEHVKICRSGLLLHNVDALTVGSCAVALEYVTLINPVIALVGGAVALAVIGKQAFDEYFTQNPTSITAPCEVYLAERNYFEHRKFALEKIKNELVATKCALEQIKPGVSFTSSFLPQYFLASFANSCDISVNQELYLTSWHKAELRRLRELQLAALEQEVAGLQLRLGLHLNELIVQCETAYRDYQERSLYISNLIDAWNKDNKANRLKKAKALEGYYSDFLDEYLVDRVEEKITELKRVVEYYTNHGMCFYLKDYSNIATLFDDLKTLIIEREKWVQGSKETIKHNMSVSEQYFIKRHMNVGKIRNKFRGLFEKQKAEAAAQALKDAEEKQKNLNQGSGGPKKDDENKDEKSRISDKDKHHIFREAEGHFPKDTPEARKLIEDMVNNPLNLDTLDIYGTSWYSKILENGKQVWAGVRDKMIRYAGINEVPWPKDSVTGMLLRPK